MNKEVINNKHYKNTKDGGDGPGMRTVSRNTSTEERAMEI
jgi:hypothetical protein